MTHPSVANLWQKFRLQNPDVAEDPPFAFYFCDRQEDADTCAELVVKGQKQATASSLVELELSGEKVSQPGDYFVITDFAGQARAIIRMTSVDIVRFDDIDAKFAWDEGEGDRTLEWWREVHRDYYRRVLEGSDVIVDDDLMIACERFTTVFVA